MLCICLGCLGVGISLVVESHYGCFLVGFRFGCLRIVLLLVDSFRPYELEFQVSMVAMW